MFDSGVRDTTDAVIALARRATESAGPTHTPCPTARLKSLLAELDLCTAICGFDDIASLLEAGCEPVMDLHK